MIPSDRTLETTSSIEKSPQTDSVTPESVNSMKEYRQLQQTLFLLAFALMGITFFSVWIVYSLNTALNYLLGAAVGVVYLKLLARDVERMGVYQQRVGMKGLALFAGLIIIAAKWQQLHIVPVFLGFLTYKVAIIAYMLQDVIRPETKVD